MVWYLVFVLFCCFCCGLGGKMNIFAVRARRRGSWAILRRISGEAGEEEGIEW